MPSVTIFPFTNALLVLNRTSKALSGLLMTVNSTKEGLNVQMRPQLAPQLLWRMPEIRPLLLQPQLLTFWGIGIRVLNNNSWLCFNRHSFWPLICLPRLRIRLEMQMEPIHWTCCHGKILKIIVNKKLVFGVLWGWDSEIHRILLFMEFWNRRVLKILNYKIWMLKFSENWKSKTLNKEDFLKFLILLLWF